MINRTQIGLFSLRVTIFVVMFMWTLDKFINVQHASSVYANFYGLSNVTTTILYGLAGLEMIIIFGFLFGIAKRWTYGLVLLFHLISTLSTYKQYLAPYEDINLLFFAAWPMLGACFCLYLLRKEDTFLSFR